MESESELESELESESESENLKVMAAHAVLGSLTKNAVYILNIDNLGSNCSRQFRIGRGRPLNSPTPTPTPTPF